MENLGKFLDSDEGKASLEKFAKKLIWEDKIQQKQGLKILDYVYTLSESEVDILFNKFLTWRRKSNNIGFEKFNCERDVQILYSLFNYMEQNFETDSRIEEIESDSSFFSIGFMLNGKYCFELYCGQGSYFHVYKK